MEKSFRHILYCDNFSLLLILSNQHPKINQILINDTCGEYSVVVKDIINSTVV